MNIQGTILYYIKVQREVTVFSLHDDLCERNVFGGDQQHPNTISLTIEYLLLLPANNLELACAAQHEMEN